MEKSGNFKEEIMRLPGNVETLEIKCICISLYSLPFTGFESLPESVQTNLSKSPRNPQVIYPAT